MSNSYFPQDFPAHLESTATSEPIRAPAALGNHPLPIETMHSAQFEQFCWWVLQRDYEIQGCQLIGGSGREQGGIDLFAYSKDKNDQLFVFECKCWKDFKASSLQHAVEHFLNNQWALPNTRFVLIIAQQSIGKLAAAWHIAREKLSARNITGELWTALELTERIRLNPDILVRFFPDATSTSYCNEWMRRVDFMQQLQKALVDERVAVRQIAQKYIGYEPNAKDNIELERIFASEGSWSINTPWLNIHSILPSRQFVTGSAAIVVKQDDTSGLTVAVSQEWILKNLLAHPGTPASHSLRPFIIHGPVKPDEQSEITIEISSARLQIPVDGLMAMCSALDKLMPIYTDALYSQEKRWGAEGYPFIGQGTDTVVAMCTIPNRIWTNILAFASAHDADAGDSEWHIFDPNNHFLKIYTTKDHPDFELGYHAFVYGRALEGNAYRDDVLLTWEPPSSFDKSSISSREWMPCSEVSVWLRDRLLPAVDQWVIERITYSPWPWQRYRRRNSLIKKWVPSHTKIWEHYQAALLDHDNYRSIGLIETISDLQGRMVNSYPALYLKSDETHALYRSLQLLMRGKHGHVPYIVSKLGLEKDCHSHAEIIIAIDEILNDELPYPTAYMVGNRLSAMLEALGGDAHWLTALEVDSIFSALHPLMHHRDIQLLFSRHSGLFL